MPSSLVITAPPHDFEGTPLRVWTAFDELGAVIETVEAEDYVAPEGAVSLTVEVGGQVVMNSAVD